MMFWDEEQLAYKTFRDVGRYYAMLKLDKDKLVSGATDKKQADKEIESLQEGVEASTKGIQDEPKKEKDDA